MKNLKDNKPKHIKSEEEIFPEESPVDITQIKPELHFETKQIKNDTLFVTFSGVIEAGVVQNCQQLTLKYLITAGPDWNVISGKETGISQIAGINGDKIVWNLPF
jgi:hypothetical protein